MNVGKYFFKKSEIQRFRVLNIAPKGKTVRVFNYPIRSGDTRDLLAIPGISEEDIRHSLLKGELRVKFETQELIVVDCDIQNIQFNDEQKTFLESIGITKGLEVEGTGNLDGTIIEPRSKENISVNFGDSFITITDIGNLKHADSSNVTGIPIYDGYDSGNELLCFVELVDGYIDGYGDGANLRVLSGMNAGERIFGLSRKGSSISPNSFEIEFYSTSVTDWDLSSINLYAWESGQPNTINISYGYRQMLDDFDENAIRSVLIQGALGGGSGSSGISLPTPTQVGQVLFAVTEDEFTVELPLTSTQGWLCSDQGLLLIVG